MSTDAKLAELQRLRSRVTSLEAELMTEVGTEWPPRSYYTAYHLLAGMVLGLVAAAASLLFNIVGAMMVGKHPLELIRVYLTFPLGEKALTMEAVDNGFILAAGCCLYLGTGMIGGIPFHMVLSRFFDRSVFTTRLLVASALGVGVWIINYYVVLAWLQPLLIGGNWIVERIPVYVAVLTHLVFAWTMLLVDGWGRFTPYGPNVGQGAARKA
jgi:hypothetical protein